MGSKAKCSKLWLMCFFFAILWSMWLMCNDVIFNAGIADFDKLIELIKWRVAIWSKARWPKILDGFEEIF